MKKITELMLLSGIGLMNQNPGIVYSDVDEMRKLHKLQRDIEKFRKNSVKPWDYFEQKYKQNIGLRENKITKEFEFSINDKIIFKSKRKTIQNAWSDFIKNYWYGIAPREIKIYIINKEKIDGLHNVK